MHESPFAQLLTHFIHNKKRTAAARFLYFLCNISVENTLEPFVSTSRNSAHNKFFLGADEEQSDANSKNEKNGFDSSQQGSQALEPRRSATTPSHGRSHASSTANGTRLHASAGLEEVVHRS